MERGVAEPTLVVLAAVFLVAPLSAALALAAGVAFAVWSHGALHEAASGASKRLLQAAIVGLGFGIGSQQLLAAGPGALAGTGFTVLVVLVGAWWAGRALGVEHVPRWLTSVGAAICGGSAIAAVGPTLRASSRDLSVALGMVFGLNAVALLAFPPLGQWMGLSQHQFGVWAALAIHDTASVVAAANSYGAGALETATVWKLARAAWLAPVVVWIASRKGTRAGAGVPWFIWGFLAAVVVRSLTQWAVWDDVAMVARRMLVVAILLVGASWRPGMFDHMQRRVVVHAATVWLVLAGVSLAVVWRWA